MKLISKAILAGIIILPMAPAMAVPATVVPPAAAAALVTGSSVQPVTVSPHPQQRRIQVILPNRQTVIVTVRPGQDDRAAAFEYLLKRPATTIAEANALQHVHRVTGIWRQGSNGIDIVDFQPW